MYSAHSARLASMKCCRMWSPSASLTTSSFSRLSSASERFAGQLVDPQPPLLALAHLEDVAVDGLARIHPVLHAVQARREHDAEREVGVARRVGHPDLDAGPHAAPRRHADERRAVAHGPRDVDRRLVARHQPLVGVDERIRDRHEALRVAQDSARVVHGGLRELVLGLGVVEDVVAALVQEGLVECIPEPLTPKIGFGMNVACRPWSSATFLTMKRKVETRSAVVTRVGVLEVDLVLPGRHLVVRGLDLEAHLLEREDDVAAGLFAPVDGGQVEVGALVVRVDDGIAVRVAAEEEELRLRAR